MKKLTVSEYAIEFAIAEATVRHWVRKGKLPVTKEIRNNRQTTLIIVEEEKKDTVTEEEVTVIKNNDTVTFSNKNNTNTVSNTVNNENVQEAEIVSDSTSYNIVSMENSTFEQLIQNIKEITDDRSRTEKESYRKLEAEYFETKQENKKLLEENKKLIIQSAQLESNVKISELKIQELREEIKALKESNNKKKNKLWNSFNNQVKL